MIRLHLLLFLGFLAAVEACRGAIVVEISDDAVTVRVPDPPGRVQVLAVAPEAAVSDGVSVWEGAGAGTIRFPRIIDGRDLLFARFLVLDASTGNPVEGGARWVTRVSIEGRATPGAVAIGKNGRKGLAAIHGYDDPVALGVRHLARNVTMRSLVTPDQVEGPFFQEVDGVKVGMREGTVRALDRDLLAAAERGMTVTLVFYNAFDRSAPPDWPLIHPKTDRNGAPAAVGAFNTVTPEGVRCLRAALEFLARRYLGGGGENGRFHGIVIGNEVQSHWMWNNQGDAEPAEVVREYAIAVRIADLATRTRQDDLPVYLSMDQHWAASHSPDVPGRAMAGREFLDRFHTLARAEGDFPWALAFHPYPENLFEPDFWDDRQCVFSPDTPKISFHNLEVLIAALHRPDWLWEGKPRRVALTEQGFNFLPRWPDAGEKQAAAYALAWKKIAAFPEIEVMHYHRHVDHPNEGGLNLGLRAYDRSAPGQLGGARPIWDVFRAAGTPEEDSVFSFALPVIGARDWATAAAVRPLGG